MKPRFIPLLLENRLRPDNIIQSGGNVRPCDPHKLHQFVVDGSLLVGLGIGIYIGLNQEDFAYLPLLLKMMVTHQGPAEGNHQQQNKEEAVRPHSPVGFTSRERFQNHEKEQGDQPDPEGSSQHTGILIPLYQFHISGKAISQGQPGPLDIPVEMGIFKGYPEQGISQVTRAAAGISAGQVGQPEHHGHQETVEKDGHKSPGGGGMQDPPGRQSVPNQKGQKSMPPEGDTAVILFLPDKKIVKGKQRQKSSKKQPPRKTQPGQTQHHPR